MRDALIIKDARGVYHNLAIAKLFYLSHTTLMIEYQGTTAQIQLTPAEIARFKNMMEGITSRYVDNDNGRDNS